MTTNPIKEFAMFTATDTLVDEVMNAAISFLESAQIPVNPDTQYTMLYTWSESFEGRQDQYAFDFSTALNLAMIRLAPNLSIPIEF